jgi:hypothetical protein
MAGRRRSRMKHTDTELLDWLQEQDGCGLISDDAGRWAVSTGGIQNMPDTQKVIDISSTFYVEAKDWRSTVREAIETAISQIEEARK